MSYHPPLSTHPLCLPCVPCRPCFQVFLDVAIDGQSVGRIELVLFMKESPRAAENMRVLCSGTRLLGGAAGRWEGGEREGEREGRRVLCSGTGLLGGATGRYKWEGKGQKGREGGKRNGMLWRILCAGAGAGWGGEGRKKGSKGCKGARGRSGKWLMAEETGR